MTSDNSIFQEMNRMGPLEYDESCQNGVNEIEDFATVIITDLVVSCLTFLLPIIVSVLFFLVDNHYCLG